jgi:hypothetical protein
MLTLRPYQQAAVDAVYDYLRQHDDNPCVVRQMHHVLRIHFLDVPEIRGVVGTEKLVGGTLLPAVECKLKTAHHVAPRQNWVHLVPHNHLADDQVAILELLRRLNSVSERERGHFAKVQF